jgi:hypothetical protein
MREIKDKYAPEPEIIHQPPVIMDPVHAEVEHVNDPVFAASIENIAFQSVKMVQNVEPQVVMKLIDYLEKNL